MADAAEDNTDGTSIRPVSSLRSHFEEMANKKQVSHPAPSVILPRSMSQYSHSSETQTLNRASLNIPRKPSPWSSSEVSGSQSNIRAPSTPISQSQLSPSPSRQRPISMVSLSPSRSLPTVTVNSPGSPPKTLDPPSVRVAPHSSSPSKVMPRRRSYYVTSGYPSLPPSHSPSREPGQDSQNVKSDGFHGMASRQTNFRVSRDTPINNGPSPVNRAEKPRIPVKQSSDVRSSNLELGTTVIDESLSPFSTPPSSDESPGLVPLNQRPQSKQLKPGTARDVKQSYFQTSSEHHSINSKTRGKISIPAQTSRPSGRRANGSPPTFSMQGDHLEGRPGLPPRRNIERMPQLSAAPAATISTAGREKYNDAALVRVTTPDTTTSEVPKPAINPTSALLPPPRRSATLSSSSLSKAGGIAVLQSTRPLPETRHQFDVSKKNFRIAEPKGSPVNLTDFPDASSCNRRPPYPKKGVREIETHYETGLLDICGAYVCTTGYLTRAWDLLSGEMVMSIGHVEKEIRVTAMAFKPGATANEEGLCLWLGNNYGDLQEVEISTQSIVRTKSSAHGRREIIKIYRHQNSMWTLDEDGKLYVWPSDEKGSPDLQSIPSSYKVPKGHTFSLIVKDNLWLATGKDIRIFRPNPQAGENFSVLDHPLGQPGVGEITSGATISGQLDRIYFGHADGKVTIYSTEGYACLGVINVSVYKISSLAGAGSYLWAGYNTGMIHVYDTQTQPWTTKKDWLAHANPVANILVDSSSVWRSGLIRVASIGRDNAVRLWDGLLEDDWLESDVQDHDTDYCSFREIKAIVVTWNVGAATPANVRYEEKDSDFFQEVLQPHEPPDLLVFGFQELVDLEDKRLTAKSLFKGNRRKDHSEHEHMSRQYREWRDFLVRCLEDNMPSNEPYHLLHTASMVGLFSCVFIKASQRNRIDRVHAVEVKRGMGGLHGNKGALILRFILDDTSLCLINCHLAAGQSQTLNRNNDAAAILESGMLPAEGHPVARGNTFVGGGDGSMIMDHEICILNGDLNYRIDTMGRDTVIKAISSANFERLLERDQLLVSRRRNPGFQLRGFTESSITFAPTYKYDVGSDRYDTSEKHRAPAWCDRILYRGAGRIKQVQYRRHEIKVSDHRPVSGTFKMRIKKIQPEKRSIAWNDSVRRFDVIRQKLFSEAKVAYLRDVLGVDSKEAQELL